ncbi:428_t:CDS:2 [Entrophospora sp. SA101]|nr:428_t:CDS:2 [Entrophospora sp. SA101]
MVRENAGCRGNCFLFSTKGNPASSVGMREPWMSLAPLQSPLTGSRFLSNMIGALTFRVSSFKAIVCALLSWIFGHDPFNITVQWGSYRITPTAFYLAHSKVHGPNPKEKS